VVVVVGGGLVVVVVGAPVVVGALVGDGGVVVGDPEPDEPVVVGDFGAVGVAVVPHRAAVPGGAVVTELPTELLTEEDRAACPEPTATDHTPHWSVMLPFT
jgi:hypothetical protein